MVTPQNCPPRPDDARALAEAEELIRALLDAQPPRREPSVLGERARLWLQRQAYHNIAAQRRAGG